MFLVAIIVLAVISGWLRKGSLANLGRQDFRLLWLVLIAFGLQFGLNWAADRQLETILRWTYAIHFCSYFLIFIFVGKNWRLPGMKLMALGMLLNFLVIAANNGAMPVNPEGLPDSLVKVLVDETVATHVLETPATRLAFLGDAILLPYPSPRRLSIGDLVLIIGLFVFVVRGMVFVAGGSKSYRVESFRFKP